MTETEHDQDADDQPQDFGLATWLSSSGHERLSLEGRACWTLCAFPNVHGEAVRLLDSGGQATAHALLSASRTLKSTLAEFHAKAEIRP